MQPGSPSLDPRTDIELMAATARGEQAALGALYDRHAPKLLGLAVRLLRRQEEAEDLVHDLFAEIWQRADRYEPSRGGVSTYLQLRLRSKGIDRLRSPAYRRMVSVTDSQRNSDVDLRHSEQVAPTTQETAVMAAAALRKVDAQTEETKTLLGLVYFHGMTLAEVATHTGLPIGTVKSRLHRALQGLRLALDTPPPGEGAVDEQHPLSDAADQTERQP